MFAFYQDKVDDDDDNENDDDDNNIDGDISWHPNDFFDNGQKGTKRLDGYEYQVKKLR